ncbi:hypothetical protein GCM10023084_22260 [Streptomyces lacrimifluminis]|uniref:Uncharacterized protein n=1 Tax=Streptomyces lacrimifluminis TaxID=1500077 RepID=A0A917NWN2_9ACTN|nr:hypothetical protein [Streptomyces lacrimifluminis]GGJ36466.1 hypothetical protein GCM10012282_36470 [Streptomyces lacrimifluminis]
MLRLTARLVTRLAAGLRPRTPSPPAPATLTQPPRTPDPYVWSLPNPHHARWRRWHRRTQHTPYKDRTDLLLPEEDCWQSPVRTPPRPSNWTTTDDVVRLYALQAMGEEQ